MWYTQRIAWLTNCEMAFPRKIALMPRRWFLGMWNQISSVSRPYKSRPSSFARPGHARPQRCQLFARRHGSATSAPNVKFTLSSWIDQLSHQFRGWQSRSGVHIVCMPTSRQKKNAPLTCAGIVIDATRARFPHRRRR